MYVDEMKKLKGPLVEPQIGYGETFLYRAPKSNRSFIHNLKMSKCDDLFVCTWMKELRQPFSIQPQKGYSKTFLSRAPKSYIDLSYTILKF